MYVEELALNEFRTIRRSTVSFVHPASPGAERRELPNINLLVGTNGGGKSTILKGIAAAALGRFVDLDALTEHRVLGWPRIGATGTCSADVSLRLHRPVVADGEASDVVAHEAIAIGQDPQAPDRVRSNGDGQAAEHELVLFGYGPRRLADATRVAGGLRGVAERVVSLLGDAAGFVPPEEWLHEASAQRPELLEVINALMPPDTRISGEIGADRRLVVRSRGLSVSWDILSDGAQSYMAWILDLAYRLHALAPDGDIRSVRGTVLVDEIDQWMHPRWQQAVLQQLSDGLPSLQFICSAHSPLIAGGLRSENLTLLEPDHDAPGEGAMRATRLSEDLYGRTADGVLTSSYFSLPSSRSSVFHEELRRLAVEAQDRDEAALAFMRTLAAGSTGQQPRARAPIVDRPERFRRRRS